MEEIWKDIPNYEGLYQVSSLGNVKSIRQNKILKPSLTGKKEYYGVSLCVNGKPKRYMIHKLVADTFLDNPENLPLINHKDENKLNNCLSNLEYCSHSYNVRYSRNNLKKPIGQYDIKGNLIRTWRSSWQIRKTLHFSSTSIDRCLIGKQENAYGYIWRYLKETNE